MISILWLTVLLQRVYDLSSTTLIQLAPITTKLGDITKWPLGRSRSFNDTDIDTNRKPVLYVTSKSEPLQWFGSRRVHKISMTFAG